MKDDDCPMCRSHKIQAPKSQSVQIRVMKQLTGPLNRINIDATSSGIGKWINGTYEDVDKSYISNDTINIMDGRILFCEKKEIYLYQADDGVWEINGAYTPITDSEEDVILSAGRRGDIIGKTTWYIVCGGDVHDCEITVTFVK